MSEAVLDGIQFIKAEQLHLAYCLDGGIWLGLLRHFICPASSRIGRDGEVTLKSNLVTVPVTFRQGTLELYLLQLQLLIQRFGLRSYLVTVTVPKA